MHRLWWVMVIVALAAACTSTPATSSPAASQGSVGTAAGSPPSGGAELGAGLAACQDDTSWLCGVVIVPLDPQDPSSPSVPIHYYILGRLDHSVPALEPVFVSPGGPGASIWANHAFVPIDSWLRNHDTVLVDPRGVGASSAISCPALDAGPSTIADQNAAVALCAASLGPSADRYGSVDRALDVEAVRAALGVDTFDYVAASAATTDAQAYAVRFPEHLHALVLDSAFPTSETLRSIYWGVGYPADLLRTTTVQCARTPECHATFPDPAGLLTRLVHTLAKAPIQDPGATAPLSTVVADEGALVGLIMSTGIGPDDLQALPLLAAASKALDGNDPVPLLQLIATYDSRASGGGSNPSVFSAGDGVAVTCTGLDLPWSKSSAIADRPNMLDASLAALPADAFAPFSHAAFASNLGYQSTCLEWPPTNRAERPVPLGTSYPTLPTLVVSGDEDTEAPAEYGAIVAKDFPGSIFALIGGVGHDASAPGYGPCGGELVDAFLDHLTVDPKLCASSDQ
jgi:pimeloyl-ACP methyl ester carboxylesterase